MADLATKPQSRLVRVRDALTPREWVLLRCQGRPGWSLQDKA
jgi:hypothetical protein